MFEKISDMMRLLVLRHKEPYSIYYPVLGFVPRNLKLYEAAMTHRSASVVSEDGRTINNERLEYLGDAVLDTVVSEVLFETYPNQEEGFLSDMRSRIVKRPQLNRMANALGISSWLISSIHPSGHNCNVCGNALEALIGAIYLDQGYDVCARFVRGRMLKPYINLAEMEQSGGNFKSRLIEQCQKHRLSLEFRVVRSFVDDDNAPVFEIEVLVDGQSLATGKGYSKKESHQHAAELALQKISALVARKEAQRAASKAANERKCAEETSSENEETVSSSAVDETL